MLDLNDKYWNMIYSLFDFLQNIFSRFNWYLYHMIKFKSQKIKEITLTYRIQNWYTRLYMKETCYYTMINVSFLVFIYVKTPEGHMSSYILVEWEQFASVVFAPFIFIHLHWQKCFFFLELKLLDRLNALILFFKYTRVLLFALYLNSDGSKRSIKV